MNKLIITIALTGLVAACERGETYDSSGAVVDTVGADTTARLNMPDVDMGLTKDTVSVPVFSTEKDTVVVDKPVVSGKKKVEVTRPTVDVNRKP